jgi:outer membrane lipoprotein SlyB
LQVHGRVGSSVISLSIHWEIADMSASPNVSATTSSRIHPLVAAAAVALIVACGTGVAAMTGLLPASKAVSSAATASPLVDTQTTTPASARNETAQQPARVVSVPQPAPRPHHRAVDAPGYVPGEASLTPPTAPAADPNAGQVVAVNAVQSPQPTTGLGAIGGAVVGGLAGTQIGNGRGRTAATIVGALGGGLAGNSIEHAVHKATTYQVQVRMTDGSYRNFTYQADPGVQVGQRVRVSGESLVAS